MLYLFCVPIYYFGVHVNLMEHSDVGQEMNLQLENKVLQVSTTVSDSDQSAGNGKSFTNLCKRVIRILSNKQHEVFGKILSLPNMIVIFWLIGEVFLSLRWQIS